MEFIFMIYVDGGPLTVTPKSIHMVGKKVDSSFKVVENAVSVGIAKPMTIHKCCANKHKAKSKLGLSALQEAEISGYLNNEKEVMLKKMLWELTNKDYLKGKQQNQAVKVKKTNPVKKAAKTDIQEDDKKKQSDKINYEILAKLMDDSLPEEDSKRVSVTGTSCSSSGTELEDRRSSGDLDNEEEEYGEEIDASEDYDGGDVDFDNEEEEYGYYDGDYD
ncbi:hypothetical protein ACFE04_013436 [Oxalis oulophora]